MMFRIVIVWLLCSWFSVASGQQSLSVFGDSFPKITTEQVLVTRHLYVACVNTEAKQPAWVAYRVQKSDWDTGNQLSRNFNTPKELQNICLETGDYKGSGYEMGHLYALQFVHGRQDGHEVNQLCAIAAQSQGLNRGVWREAENRIKTASETETVTVLAGQLWLDQMPELPKANESHRIASHQWIMWKTSRDNEAYLIPQSVKRTDSLSSFTIDRSVLQGKISASWGTTP
jgi:DNA/RNA endonuclease G (NUC1)